MALTSAVAEPQKKISRLTRSSKLLKVIIQSIHDKKGEHVVSIDLRKVSEAVSDFFIVCEAPSTVQVRAIADWIEMRVKEECGEYPYKREGTGVSQWVLVDYVNVVIHVFLSETRKFYKLEEMWNDGISQEELEAGTEKEPTKPKKEAKALPANKKKPKAL